MNCSTAFLPDEDFPIEPVGDRSAPPLWVRRLVIVESRAPASKVIRDVSFRPGLNIICVADRPEGETRSVGHSVGKTLMVRLIRYCLGESHFAVDSALNRIARALPGAYVLAEIAVEGEFWIVARPLRDAPSGDSYAIPTDDWRAGLGDVNTLQRFGDFLDALARATIERLPPLFLPDAGRMARWLDLLAWMSRDQECSFQHVNEWRNPDANSGTARLHRNDASLLMRWAMGLLRGDEIQILAEHNRLRLQRIEADQEVEQIRVSIKAAQSRLQTQLGISEEEFPEDFFAHRARQLVDEKAESLRRLMEEFQDDSGLNELHSEVIQTAQAVAVAEDGLQRLRGLEQGTKNELLQRRESSAEEYYASFDPNRLCPLSSAECPRHSSNLSDGVRDPDREAKIAELERLITLYSTQIDDIEHRDLPRVQEQHAQAQWLYRQERQRRDDNLRGILTLIARWELQREEVDEYERYRQQLKKIDSRSTQLKRDLDQSLKRQKAARRAQERGRKRLSGYYDWTLKKLIGPDAGGQVQLDARGVYPVPDLSVRADGAALGTLSTVLSLDLACLTASLCGVGHLPAFFIHDSPKEADLESILYDRLFTLALDLEQSYHERSPAFQYIVTTTSPPPSRVATEPYIRLLLDAREPAKLLLHQSF